MREKSRYEEQAKRQKKFPKDRIAFLPIGAVQDCISLKYFAKGEISFDRLCSNIAYNNYLEEYFPDGKIPKDMMENELKLMGWWYE